MNSAIALALLPLLIAQAEDMPAAANSSPALALAKAAPGTAKDEKEEIPWHIEPNPVDPNVPGPFNLKDSVKGQFMGRTVFPRTTSPFVAMSSEKPVKGKDALRVYDLRRMTQVGATLEGVPKHPLTLSPDGVYLALRGNEKLDDKKPTVEVWSVATGQRVQQLEVDADPKVWVEVVDFAEKDRLVTAKRKGRFVLGETMTTYQVWDLKTGQQLVEFSYPLIFHSKYGTLTPGGKYLVMEHTEKGYHILFWDLATGKLAGTFEFQDKKDLWGQAAGLAFAPDGTELALLWRLGKKPDNWGRLMVFDVKTTKKLYDHQIGYEYKHVDSVSSEGGAKTLQWLPEQRRWLLFNYLWLERETGAAIWKFAHEPKIRQDIRACRFLNPDHVAVKSGERGLFLMVEALPRDKIDAATKEARAKGKVPAK